MIEKIFTYVLIFFFTLAAPSYSLCALVLLSPWNLLNDLLGWDPRIGWSMLLAARATIASWSSEQARLPRAAVWGVMGFVAITFFGLHLAARDISGEELESANSTFLYFLCGACLSFAIVELTNTRARVLSLVVATSLSLVCASGVGLAQASTSYFSGLPSDRIPGTLGNPNYFAAYLALGATAMVTFSRLKVLNRFLALLSCAIAAAACVLTFSRMGTLACFLGVALAAMVQSIGKLVDWKGLVSLSTLVLVVVLVWGYLANFRQSITYSDQESQLSLARLGQTQEDLSRLEAFKFSWEVWAENPVLGAGLGTFAARNYKTNGIYVTTHDTYMQVLAGTGVVGAALILWVFVSLLRSLPSASRRYLLPAMAVIAACSFFGDYLQSMEIFAIFSVLFVLLRSLEPDGCHLAGRAG